jgi:hypothetical protein
VVLRDDSKYSNAVGTLLDLIRANGGLTRPLTVIRNNKRQKNVKKLGNNR